LLFSFQKDQLGTFLYASIYSEAIQQRNLKEATEADGQLVLVAAFVLYLCISLNTRSALKGLVCVLFVIFSVGAAALVTVDILQVRYKSILNQLNFITVMLVSADMLCLMMSIRGQTLKTKFFEGKTVTATSFFFY
jgi:hypothetical protein